MFQRVGDGTVRGTAVERSVPQAKDGPANVVREPAADLPMVWDAGSARFRLIEAGSILVRIPLKNGRDWLAPELQLKPNAKDDPQPKPIPSAPEIDLMNRTLDQIGTFSPTERLILLGIMLDKGALGISKRLARSKAEGVQRLSERTVRRRMQHVSILFARRLNAAREPMDGGTMWRILQAEEAQGPQWD